jgi:hypothetical protein
VTYGTQQLLEEVSYVAYHFHWPFDQILDLEHPLRREFVRQIGAINAAVNAASAAEVDASDGAGADPGEDRTSLYAIQNAAQSWMQSAAGAAGSTAGTRW